MRRSTSLLLMMDFKGGSAADSRRLNTFLGYNRLAKTPVLRILTNTSSVYLLCIISDNQQLKQVLSVYQIHCEFFLTSCQQDRFSASALNGHCICQKQKVWNAERDLSVKLKSSTFSLTTQPWTHHTILPTHPSTDIKQNLRPGFPNAMLFLTKRF